LEYDSRFRGGTSRPFAQIRISSSFLQSVLVFATNTVSRLHSNFFDDTSLCEWRTALSTLLFSANRPKPIAKFAEIEYSIF
ncbi:MAG: hypothetical protein LBJ12_00885, partial [Oscillospiraceae bacterium]|nr:hypothetical protein [Oscillospiraceae bacterium]